MATASIDPVLRFVRRLAASRPGASLSDAQLLERFAERRDEAAFAAIVERHGPLVLAACRRILTDNHASEDCFQATFLVLARKAGALNQPEGLAPWLYGVAVRTALKARAEADRRRVQERKAAVNESVEVADDLLWRDLRPVLDEAIAALPECYRVPFVLHHLEGETVVEVARRLGCPQGTIAARLARAKERLRTRLTRRGVTLSGGALAAVLAESARSACVPPSLLISTASAAAVAAGTSAAVFSLARGGVKTMVMTKASVAGLLLLALGASVGLSLWGERPLAAAATLTPDKEPPRRMPPADDAAVVAEKAVDPFAPNVPTVPQLIAYLNDHARRKPVLRADKVSVDVKVDRSSVGLEGRFILRQPGDVRATCNIVGRPGLDFGSNEQGWWFWKAKDENPHGFQAKRKDVVRGTATDWPFAADPEVLIWIMGMKKYEETAPVEAIASKDTIEFVEKVASPQGKPLRRITVFYRAQAATTQGQIKGYRLEDADKKELLRVDVREIEKDRASGAVVPTRLELVWPAEKTRIVMRIYSLEVCDSLTEESALRLFTPPSVITEPGAKP